METEQRTRDGDRQRDGKRRRDAEREGKRRKEKERGGKKPPQAPQVDKPRPREDITSPTTRRNARRAHESPRPIEDTARQGKGRQRANKRPRNGNSNGGQARDALKIHVCAKNPCRRTPSPRQAHGGTQGRETGPAARNETKRDHPPLCKPPICL